MPTQLNYDAIAVTTAARTIANLTTQDTVMSANWYDSYYPQSKLYNVPLDVLQQLIRIHLPEYVV